MTEENLNETTVVETKECDCPVCKVLKSECFKKFLGVVLASFIGCSLALLVFAPKKPPCMRKMTPPYERMMPVPPPMQGYGEFHHKGMRPDFRGEHFKRGEFQRHEEGLKRPDWKKDFDFKRPMKPEGANKPFPPKTEQPKPVIE